MSYCLLPPFHPTPHKTLYTTPCNGYYGSMPDVTVYIKRDDYESWKALPSKTGFIHENLKRAALREIKLPQFEKPIKAPAKNPICKRGHLTDDYGYCFDLNCKYSR